MALEHKDKLQAMALLRVDTQGGPDLLSLYARGFAFGNPASPSDPDLIVPGAYEGVGQYLLNLAQGGVILFPQVIYNSGGAPPDVTVSFDTRISDGTLDWNQLRMFVLDGAGAPVDVDNSFQVMVWITPSG